MQRLSEQQLVYAAAAACVAMSQIYYLARAHRADKIYLLKRIWVTTTMKNNDDHSEKRHRFHLEPENGSEKEDMEEQVEEQILMQSKSNMPSWPRIIRIWYVVAFIRNLMLVLKYLLLCLLDYKSLAHLRYLDCFLIGRVSFNGRIVSMVKYAVLCVVFFQLVWRIIILFIKPNFHFESMEFLLLEPNKLLLWEAQSDTRTSTGNRKQPDDNPATMAQDEFKYSTLLDYRNPFAASSRVASHERSHFVRLRPNRTFRAWRQLSRIFLAYLALLTTFFVLIALLLMRMSLAMQLTTPGFKLNYRHCVDWVRRQPNGLEYEFIYSGISSSSNGTRRMIARAFMPFEDFMEFNSYQILRLLADLLENCLFFSECLFSFFAYSTLAIVMAADMRQYCWAINARVNQLIERLRQMSAVPVSANQPLITRRTQYLSRFESNQAIVFHNRSLFNNNEKVNMRLSLASQLLDTQAIIKDFFNQVHGFNSFAAFFTLFTICIWFSYSAICASWLVLPEEMADPGKFEWYTLQALASAFTFIIVGSLNSVRYQSVRLYLAICTLASLDKSRARLQQDRWLTLMRHYSPVPLAYFTTSRRSPISWLLGVQIFSWLVSALFVASGFFVPHH